jgi:hypothetical protein
MQIAIALAIDVLLCVLCAWLLWQREKLWRRIEYLIDELQTSNNLLRVQGQITYQQAVSLHGREVADRAIAQERERWSN